MRSPARYAKKPASKCATSSYQSSQPWPFPASLMLGFHAGAGAQQQIRRGTELEDVQWFSRAELLSGRVLLPPPQAIARRLIGSWLDAG